MRTFMLLLCTMMMCATGKGQDQAGKVTTSGKITYEEKVKLEFKVEGDVAKFAEELPKEQVNVRVLYFNPDYSLYQAGETKKAEELEPQEGGMRIRMINGGEGDKIFCDFKGLKKTEQKEFMTRMFLIGGDLVAGQWKIKDNFKTILGYNCQEAVSADTAKKVTAWFTTSIPVSTGPAGFSGLPGMILMADLNDGKRIITATVIDPVPVDAGILSAPKDGKKVTPEEFKKIVDEKMKEMGVQNGQGTNHIMIRIQN